MAVKRYGVVDTEPLAQPLTFARSGRTAKNRLMKSSMAEYLADWSREHAKQGGVPTDEHVKLYKKWAEGGWGMILTGNIDVQYDALDAAGDMIIATEHAPEGERFEKFKEIAAAGTATGGLIIGQLSHPGRQVAAHINPVALSASDVQLEPKFGMEFGKPHAASEEEIAHVVKSFAHASAYLDKAGFSGIELHAAHGYLISQFLSRSTNLRTDRYGVQTVENRLRLIAEIVEAIKAAVSPGFIIGVKLNSVEFQNGGVTPEEAMEVVKGLEDQGVDFVELSGGTYEQFVPDDTQKESTKLREAFYLDFVKAITGATASGQKMKTYLVGGLRSAGAMVEALDVVDGVAVARAAAAEPDLANKLLDPTPEKRVTGAIVPASKDALEHFNSLLLARVQISQMGRGWEPLAYGDADVMAKFDFDFIVKQMHGGVTRLEVKP